MFIKRFKKNNKSLYSFFKYYKKHKKLIIFLLIVMLLASSLGMLLPYFYSKRLIGVTNISFDSVFKYSVLIILIIVFHHTFWYLWEYLASILTNKVKKDIRKDIINKLFEIEYLEIKNKTTGYFLERLNDDTYEVSSFLSNVLGTIVDSLTNFSFLILIYFLNYKCGIIFSIGIIVLYIIDSFKIKKDLKYIEMLKEMEEVYNSKINENVKGIKVINGLGIKDEILKVSNNIINEISFIQIKKDKIGAFLSRTKTFIQYLLECILIIYSIGVLIPEKSLTVVVLLMILDYSGFMYDLTGFIAKMKDYFVKGEYKAKRILEILDNTNIYEYKSNNIKLNKFNIIVKNLSYSYNNKNVLNNINFSIKENSLNIFIGQSGSGKSTLFGILTGLLKIDNNHVFIGDIDINEINDKDLKKDICIINQDPFLIKDTILNNIKIVKPDADKKEIIEVCKKANIYDEIINMNDKFHTLILENGNNLSGGQKQRIEIARALLKNSKIILFDEPTSALLKNSKIILFDEPTSALDSYNQKMFFKTIKELKKEKTILIIGHKIKRLNMFDNVYELKNKKLIRKQGYYVNKK